MPQVVVGAAIAGGAAAAGAFVTGGAVLSSFLSVGGGTLVLGGINHVLNRPKKIGDAFAREDFSTQTEFTVFDPAAHRRVVYGETSVGGIVAYKEKKNDFLTFLVVMYASHECQQIVDTLVNGKSATDSRYIGASLNSSNLGFTFNTRIGQWTLCSSAGQFWDNYFPDLHTPFNVSGSVSNDGIWKRNGAAFTEIVTGRLCVPVQKIDGTTPATEAEGASITLQIKYLWVSSHLGSDNQTADSLLTVRSDKWTSDHRLRGICYEVLTIAPHRNAFPQGLESIRAIIKGKKDIYDPRGPTTGYSTNVALCCANFWTDTQFGFGADYSSTVDETALIAAANVCDEDVTLAASGTEDRYTCNGSFDTSQVLGTTLGKLATAMAGHAFISGGKLILKAGAYETPTISFSDTNYVGPVTCETRLKNEERFNGVKGVYREPFYSYGVRNFPAQISSTYQTQDGKEKHANIQLEFTNSVSMAQRIARILLLKSRQQITWRADHNLYAYILRPGNTASIFLDRFGWSSKVFDVTGMALAVKEGRAAVNVQYRETSSTVYDWNTGLETQIDPAPDTNLPDPAFAPSVGNLLAESAETDTNGDDILIRLNDGTVLPRIKVSWNAAEGFVGQFEIEWTNTTTFVHKSAILTGTVFYIDGVKEGEVYNIVVRSINTFGARSTPFTLNDHVVIGRSSPPPDVTTFSVRATSTARVFSWTLNNPPLDLAGYKIKYWQGSGGTWFQGDFLHTGLLQQSPYETIFPVEAGTYTFNIKAFDTTGNESANALAYEISLPLTEVGDVFSTFNAIDQAWAGTVTNAFVEPKHNYLVPKSTILWSAAGTWDSLGNWNDRPEEEYSWESEIFDRGVVISGLPIITIQTDAAVLFQERHSTDGVSYTSYSPILGIITYRYIQYKLTLSTL